MIRCLVVVEIGLDVRQGRHERGGPDDIGVAHPPVDAGSVPRGLIHGAGLVAAAVDEGVLRPDVAQLRVGAGLELPEADADVEARLVVIVDRAAVVVVEDVEQRLAGDLEARAVSRVARHALVVVEGPLADRVTVGFGGVVPPVVIARGVPLHAPRKVHHDHGVGGDGGEQAFLARHQRRGGFRGRQGQKQQQHEKRQQRSFEVRVHRSVSARSCCHCLHDSAVHANRIADRIKP